MIDSLNGGKREGPGLAGPGLRGRARPPGARSEFRGGARGAAQSATRWRLPSRAVALRPAPSHVGCSRLSNPPCTSSRGKRLRATLAPEHSVQSVCNDSPPVLPAAAQLEPCDACPAAAPPPLPSPCVGAWTSLCINLPSDHSRGCQRLNAGRGSEASGVIGLRLRVAVAVDAAAELFGRTSQLLVDRRQPRS